MRFLPLLFGMVLQAAVSPLPISRQSAQIFTAEGLFQGGSAGKASLEAIRFSPHSKSRERWVIDFSDPTTQKVGTHAPLFQLRYVKGNSVGVPSQEVILSPAKFVLNLRAISQNKVEPKKVARLIRKSDLVQDIVFYPAIEEGDMALEIILKKNVLFEAHQPVQNEGRLVLDLKPAASR